MTRPQGGIPPVRRTGAARGSEQRARRLRGGSGGGRWTGCWNCCSGDSCAAEPSGSPRRAGRVFTVGDGTGQPVAVRFMTNSRRSAACCSIPSSSSAKPTWTARCGSRKARSPTCSRSCSARPPTACRRTGRGRNGRLRYLHRRLQQFNPPTRARRNVAHHYDLDGRLYSLFLDADRQYTCAYFETPGPVARRRPARQEAPSRRQARC